MHVIYVLDRDPTVFHHVMEYIIIQMKYQQLLVNIVRTKNFGDYYEKKLSILVWTVSSSIDDKTQLFSRSQRGQGYYVLVGMEE